jgi:hypothetical protein
MPKRSTRFAVGDPDSLRSSEWLVVSNTKTSDVYVMSRTIGGVFKSSVHESGRCHVRAPGTAKWAGTGPPPAFLQEWHIDPRATVAFPFGIIVPTSELRERQWPSPHKKTVWLRPRSTATEIGVFLTNAEPTAENLNASGWSRVLSNEVLPDGRHLSIVVGYPELPEAKSNELVALKDSLVNTSFALLENPRLVLVAGDVGGTHHFVEAAATR